MSNVAIRRLLEAKNGAELRPAEICLEGLLRNCRVLWYCIESSTDWTWEAWLLFWLCYRVAMQPDVDVCEQWKEKGLGWLLPCEFSNALNMEPHSCLCFGSLDFQCNVLDFTLEAIVNAHSSSLSMLHGVLLPFYRSKPHLAKKREWIKSSPFLAVNSHH